jgi:L-ascorbate metabolism protein UlaG (beta-lactamase superfamily)
VSISLTAPCSTSPQKPARLLDTGHDGETLPRGLDLEWLGVAGYRLSYEGQTIYIDPYLSRVLLSSVIRRAPTHADPTLHERYLRPAGRVVGVLVGHTHFDHAIDVPAIRTNGTSAPPMAPSRWST